VTGKRPLRRPDPDEGLARGATMPPTSPPKSGLVPVLADGRPAAGTVFEGTATELTVGATIGLTTAPSRLPATLTTAGATLKTEVITFTADEMGLDEDTPAGGEILMEVVGVGRMFTPRTCGIGAGRASAMLTTDRIRLMVSACR
jgi:hypothetical protein